MTRTHPDEAQALREEIDQLRGELGQTVQALAERVDVPARVRAARGRMVRRARAVPPSWLAAGGAAGAAVTVLIVLAMMRRGRRR